MRANISCVAAIAATLVSTGAAAKTVVTQTETLRASTKLSESTLRAKMPSFSVTKTYKTASGKSITGQQYLNLLNTFQAAADKAGCTLGSSSGTTCQFQASEATFTAAELNQAATLAATKIVPIVDKTKSAKSPLGFSWSKQWGTQSKAAVYVGADFGNSGGSTTASCSGSAYAGAYLFNNQKEIIRLTGSVYAIRGDVASEKGSSGVYAKAALYVLGDSDAIWSKTTTGSLAKTSMETKSYSVSKSFTYWGLITISLAAKASGAAYITPSLSATSSTNEAKCALTVTPGVRASVGGSAEISILGFGDLSAAAVGVEANVVLADLSLPITASVSAKNNSGTVTFTESLSASLDMNYLSGSLSAYFSTSFPLDGEKWHDWDKDKFSFTILEWPGYNYKEPLFSTLNATQTL